MMSSYEVLKRALFFDEDEKPFQCNFSLGSLTERPSWNFAWCCEDRGVALRAAGERATAERDPLPMARVGESGEGMVGDGLAGWSSDDGSEGRASERMRV